MSYPPLSTRLASHQGAAGKWYGTAQLVPVVDGDRTLHYLTPQLRIAIGIPTLQPESGWGYT
jgi:hypothetical protein